MEFVIAIMNPVVSYMLLPVKKHLGFLVSSKKYFREMDTKMKQLDATVDDIKNRMEANNVNSRMIPHLVPDWLAQVEVIKAEAESIDIKGNGCFNMKMRYKAGKQSSNILKKIDDLTKEESKINWTNQQIPLGKVDSKKTSTSTVVHDSGQSSFESRDLIFKDALESLQPNNKIQKIALCGMGGVGKTTMMEQLKKVVQDTKLFNWVMKVEIGQNPNPIAVQQAIAEYMGESLTETDKGARADRLHERFQKRIEASKNKILVILDDIWEEINLKDIGLVSPLPDGIKLLLTSRDENVCAQMGVDTNSIFRIGVLKELEARDFFWKIAGPSNGDSELYKIGDDIVKRCGGLPIALKTIASTLRDNIKDAWEDALFRLQNNDFPVLDSIFEISYNNLKENDDRSVFLFSGLFSNDSNISIEELMRCGWGLKLFNDVNNLETARHRMNTCINRLIRSNLLVKSDRRGCVKMHDLVHDFALRNFPNVKQALLVNNDNVSERLATESYERVLIKCTGLSEFPIDVKHPNLTLLKLMDGNERLKFPEDFYEAIEKLEVVAYEKMHIPLLPQYSPKLRTLCLRSCSLIDDFSFLGNLINLEILSFAHCRLRKLPSTIGKLKKLKLLDLTGCVNLCIDDGVLQNLVNLKELYMRVSVDSNAVRFSDADCEALEILSKELFALEMEFFENKAQPKNVSFRQLKRFRISIGCLFKSDENNDINSFKKSLKLVTNRNELLECKINDLFKKTEKLLLQVSDMNHLEDILDSLHPSQHSFCNLKVLDIIKCVDLRYLFTIHVASGLTKLQRLTIAMCPVLETLVHDDNNGSWEIKFQELKFLSLNDLPKLVSLCDIGSVVELPQLMELRLREIPKFTSIYPEKKTGSNFSTMQPLFTKEDVIPKLEKLKISSMKKLKQIWPCQFSNGEESNVSFMRKIEVKQCDSLENLFPSNPMPLLKHLVELEVKNCGSVEVLFNIDLGCVGIFEEVGSYSLRSIELENLGKLREVWRIKGANNLSLRMRSFQAVERIYINKCELFKNIFTPTTTCFDMRALTDVIIIDCGESGRNNNLVKNSQEEKINAFPSYLIRDSHELRNLHLRNHKGVEVVFDIESPGSRGLLRAKDSNAQRLLYPYLKDLKLEELEMMTHVWKCNWNEFLILPRPDSSFHNLTTIVVERCKSITYLLSPLMAKLLYSLKKVHIKHCDGFEEVVSNRDDNDREMITPTTTRKSATALYPLLDSLTLSGLRNLKRIDGAGAQAGSGEVSDNNTTTNAIGYNQFKRKVVDSERMILCEEEVPGLYNLLLLGWWRTMLLALRVQSFIDEILKKVHIKHCDGFEEVVSNRDDNDREMITPTTTRKSATVLYPLLDSLTLSGLRNLKRIDGAGAQAGSGEVSDNNTTTNAIGYNQFKSSQVGAVWSLCQYSREISIRKCDAIPSLIPYSAVEQTQKLEKLTIWYCESMKEVFETHVMDNSSTDPDTTPTSPRLKNIIRLKLPNLKILIIKSCHLLEHIFTFSTLESLRQLEKLTIMKCNAMKVVVKEEIEEQTTASNIVVFPCLKSIVLVDLPNLEGFFMGMGDFHWPSLDKVTIDACPQLTVFTSGRSMSPKLRYMHTSLGKHSLECGLNFHVTTTLRQTASLSSDSSSSCPSTLERLPWSFHNLIEIDVQGNLYMEKIIPSSELLQLQNLEKIHVKSSDLLSEVFEVAVERTNGGFSESPIVAKFPNLKETASLSSDSSSSCPSTLERLPWSFHNLIEIDVQGNLYMEKIIPSSELLQLQNLEKIHVKSSDLLSEVFEVAVERTNGGFSESPIVAKFPNLKEVDLEWLHGLKYIWKSNRWTLLEFPNLTRLSIDYCSSLEHIFTSSMVGSLLQLQDLHIIRCKNVESLKLEKLNRLKGFCLGKANFSWPSLSTLEIKICPEIMVFTKGYSATPKLTIVETSLACFTEGKTSSQGLVFRETWSVFSDHEYIIEEL
ncbi:resistance protein candidate RGC2 [Artemisia annua]|uniref:Resistance protein candidate RGC2 n=1 Tax=Artemisia annua TaxID=35608 RepID=A0A2U1LIR0_ARTAN|nr:resistance protein candidate RGC2 [Artemisia annua]